MFRVCLGFCLGFCLWLFMVCLGFPFKELYSLGLGSDRNCYAVIENFSRRRITSPRNLVVLCGDVMRRRVIAHITAPEVLEAHGARVASLRDWAAAHDGCEVSLRSGLPWTVWA